jgi:FSR family fosmidomycin resistance protein-like MFS transporter
LPVVSVQLAQRPPESPAIEHAAEPGGDRRRLLLLALGHALTDTYGQSMLAPLFPLLALQLNLTKPQIGALTAIMGLSASLGQPVWGWLSDRWPRICLVALGPALAALACSSVGLASSYGTLAACIVLTGLGVGAFHPQAAALARRAGRGSGLAMSAFTVGGNVGFGVAPLLAALYYRTLGLEHFSFAALPGLAMAGFLALNFSGRAYQPPPPTRAPHGGPARAASWRPLAFLTGTVVLRSAVQIGMTTFLPFMVGQRFAHADPTAARGMVVSTFLLASALSGPVGGHLADRLGRKRVMWGSFLLAPWPLVLAFHLPGYAFIASLALGGFILMMPHPANVVMAQEYMPRSAGIAASMITGLAWGLAQLLAYPLALATERFGIAPALMGLSLLPLLGVVLVAPLPNEKIGEHS